MIKVLSPVLQSDSDLWYKYEDIYTFTWLRLWFITYLMNKYTGTCTRFFSLEHYLNY